MGLDRNRIERKGACLQGYQEVDPERIYEIITARLGFTHTAFSPPTPLVYQPLADQAASDDNPLFEFGISDPEGLPLRAYHLQVASDPGFGSVLIDSSQDFNWYIHKTLPPGHSGYVSDKRLADNVGSGFPYYWRLKVQDQDASGNPGTWSDWTDPIPFYVENVTPEVSIIDPQPWETVNTVGRTIHWTYWDPKGSPQTTATIRFIEYMRGTILGSAVVNSSATSWLSDAAVPLSYRRLSLGLQVTNQAGITSKPSLYRAIISFNQVPIRGIPSSPVNGETVNSPVSHFAWTFESASATAQSEYRLQVGTDSAFSTTLYDLCSLSSDPYCDLAQPISAPGQYYWRIGVNDGSQPSVLWSAPESFVIGNPDTAPPVTTHDYPSDGQWARLPAAIHLTATDDHSGVAATYYCIDGGTQTEGTTLQITSEGEHSVQYWSVDHAGNVETARTLTVKIDQAPPTLTNLQPRAGTYFNVARPIFSIDAADNLSGIDAASAVLMVDGAAVVCTVTLDQGRLTLTPTQDLAQGNHSAAVSVSDRAGNPATDLSTSFTIDLAMPTLPPDPAEVAPPLMNASGSTDIGSATRFLYTGESPIQTGVAPDTIKPQSAAVLRGRVLDRDGRPLPGAVISVLGHPEFGQTVSRQDGVFDLAVNGGGVLTVKYQRTGYLGAQRQVEVPWQDYAWLPDVVLIKRDNQATPLDLTNTTDLQVARGSVVTDQDGTRQATLFFPPGIQATNLNSPTLTVRATEYSVGENGPQAMPGELPPNVAYTYCVELTVDEAEAQGIGDVHFNQPVYFYVENFLDFPVGIPVPAGYYDSNKAARIPSDSGRIIQILGVTDGLADLDVTGTGQAADATALAALGFTDAERQRLASLYTPGQSLWRVPLTHYLKVGLQLAVRSAG